MKRWQIILIVGTLAFLMCVGGFQLYQYLKLEKISEQGVVIQKPVSSEEIIGIRVENFSLSDLNGEQRSLSEWQGKVIAINFWATWCPPCREEIPAFVELQQQYSSEGLQFIGIALQQAEELRGFIDEFNVNYPSLVGGDDVIKLATHLGNDIGALPYTVIIDRSGKIAFTRRGPLSKSEAETVIQTYL